MKKIALMFFIIALGISPCFAYQNGLNECDRPLNELAASSVSVPTGAYFNGKNFVYVQSTWLRIVINGNTIFEGDFHAEMDPYGNYALRLDNGESITIYSNGRSLYYDGDTYSKK